MAKRFTDTEKWKKDFIRSLPPEYKLIWFYITDECDIAGVWEEEWDILQIRTGILTITKDQALRYFSSKVFVFDGGKKWFLVDFIGFQYGELNPKNRYHKAVIDKLTLYENKGLRRSLEGPQYININKDKDKNIIGGGVGEEVVYPIEHCAEIAMNDERWVRANKTTQPELEIFNGYLEKTSTYQKNPLDYKRHFAHFKHKYPDRLKPTAKELSMDEWLKLAEEFDKTKKLA